MLRKFVAERDDRANTRISVEEAIARAKRADARWIERRSRREHDSRKSKESDSSK